MQTLNDRLIKYCTEHVKELPYGPHLQMIGKAVSNELREKNKSELVQKTEATIKVNAYPEDLLADVDAIIELYFKDKKALMAKAKMKERPVKYFNYDVEAHKAPAFEEALKKCGMAVTQNFNQDGIAQYKIPVSNAAHLVKLGKVFQKERWLQENKNKINKIVDC